MFELQMGNLYSDSSVGLDLKMSHLNLLNTTLDQNPEKWHHYQMLNCKIFMLRVEPKVTFKKYLGYSKNSSGRSEPNSLYVIRSFGQ